jgi:hypothetical protein
MPPQAGEQPPMHRPEGEAQDGRPHERGEKRPEHDETADQEQKQNDQSKDLLEAGAGLGILGLHKLAAPTLADVTPLANPDEEIDIESRPRTMHPDSGP